ncbi:MAG: sodium/proline symporter [Planctomycetes bacterium]|nr:sodium/proline symporter [Planctomycetota bacterium]MCB9869536.1 sodium/proline symporter [Planctomycetota bacterium]MCB9889923.1 sodium/proline symporter [Planctomycetota bacterium]
MDRTTTILTTLVVYKAALLGIGYWASRMTKDRDDLYLGGRQLGPVVAAMSASASSSSVWTLLGVSGMAFQTGLASLWLFPCCVGGFAINWFLLAPRLRQHSRDTGAVTLTDVLAGAQDRPGRQWIVRLAAMITLASLLGYVASQLAGASLSFESFLPELDPRAGVVAGGVIVVLYMMMGGFWAVSLTDTLQGVMMALTALALPIAALCAVGGFGPLFEQLPELTRGQAGYLSLTKGLPLVTAVGFVLGLLGIPLGYPGQPHVVNRFMALRDARALRHARVYAMVWAVLVYSGMILTGLCGRVLLRAVPDGYDNEQMFFDLSAMLFHPVVTGIMLAAVLSAIMSTADSQLLVAASTVNHDLGLAKRVRARGILLDRLVILALTTGAVVAALGTDQSIFHQVLFAWSGMGAAFGPLLVWLLWRGPVRVRSTLWTMGVAFGINVVGHLGDVNKLWKLQKVDSQFLPYVAAIAVLWWMEGRRQRSGE